MPIDKSIVHPKCILFKSADVAVSLTEALEDRAMAALYPTIVCWLSVLVLNGEDAEDIGGREKSRSGVKPNNLRHLDPRGEFNIKMCYATGKLILVFLPAMRLPHQPKTTWGEQ